jgi:hypothetical protein
MIPTLPKPNQTPGAELLAVCLSVDPKSIYANRFTAPSRPICSGSHCQTMLRSAYRVPAPASANTTS